MSYYQNVFPQEFIGNWVLGDRQASLSFRCPANTGRGDEVVQSYGNPTLTAGDPTFNLSANDPESNATTSLRIWYARDFATGFKGWTQLAVVIAGPGATVPTTAATTTPTQIVANLNADTTFATMFVASVGNNGKSIVIRQAIPITQLKFYIDNRAAETILLFNARAGVAELPCYFDRHTIRQRFAYIDGMNHLIDLSHDITNVSVANPGVITSLAHGLANTDLITIDNSNSTGSLDTASVAVANVTADTFTTGVNVTVLGNYGVWARLVDFNVITNATDKNGNTLGYSLATTKRDYQLLAGRSGIFNFQKITVDAIGTGRITKIIEYPAGAVAGNMGRLIEYKYTDAKTNPDIITEEPYVLTNADLVTPPVV
ncbi:MAG: hypothetical protein M0R80_08520 [Proteobacteria bacterium]|jgi:hypothetical protein|nr:hypothetical protein [Pseudomonadota bacterium]